MFLYHVIFNRSAIACRGVWGTVCDDYFSDTDARVVCRQLGFSSSNTAVRGLAYYGQGSGVIWLDDVRCYGYESRLSSCGHSGWDIGNCRHNEDVGVSCGKPRYIVLCCLNSYLLVQVINLSYRHIRYIDTFLLSLASCTDTTTAVYTTAVIVVAVSVPLVMTVIIRLFVVGCCRKRERIDRRTTGRHHGTGRPLSTRVMYSDATRQPEVHIADDIRETWPSEGYYPSRQRTTIRRQPEDAPPSYAVVIRYPELFPSPTSADHTRQLDDLHPCKWT